MQRSGRSCAGSTERSLVSSFWTWVSGRDRSSGASPLGACIRSGAGCTRSAGPELGQLGRWMAATLACGSGAVLSHGSAAALWGFGKEPRGRIEVSVPRAAPRNRPGIRVHRRPALLPEELTAHEGIPVTSPIRTLIDEATRLRPMQLERAVNEADKLDWVDPETLRAALERYRGQPGVARHRRRDRRAAPPPHRLPADPGVAEGPDSPGGGTAAAALLARADSL